MPPISYPKAGEARLTNSTMLIYWLQAIGGIILIDLVLSGDNALVIGTAAATIPGRLRLLALITGGGAAIIFRILFTYFATLLLQLPYLQAAGGCILVIIAIRFLLEQHKSPKKQVHHRTDAQAQRITPSSCITDKLVAIEAPPLPTRASSAFPQPFFSVLLTILVADVTMSLDNVVAVGALASGNLLFLIIGLLISIIFLLFASALIAQLMGRFPWLIYAAAIVLGWTASTMILQDRIVGPFVNYPPWVYIIPIVILTVILATGLFVSRRKRSKN